LKGSFARSTAEPAARPPELIARLRDGLNRHWGIALAAIKSELAYRFEFFSAIFGTLITTVLLYFLWVAVYESAVSMQLSRQSLITYVVLGQAFSFGRPGQRRAIVRISGNIRSGNVALDLIRPTDYQLLHFSDTLAVYITETLMVSLPSYVLALLVFGIDAPASWEAAAGFVVSLSGAFLLVFSLDFFIGLMAFWTVSVWGMTYAKMAVVDVLAGTIVPLSLFPAWLERVAMALPFRGIAYVPLSIYTGAIHGADIWTNILVQFAWGVALILFTRLIWLRARRRLVVQGG
jgi:viologen exporter family transport system permease protein